MRTRWLRRTMMMALLARLCVGGSAPLAAGHVPQSAITLDAAAIIHSGQTRAAAS